MQGELVFEIGTEEIPAGYINPALDNMTKLLSAKLDECSLAYGKMQAVATPRRLTVAVRGLAAGQEDRVEQITGPPKNIAFDPQGNLTKAGEGFARSQQVPVEALQVMTTRKGDYLMVRKERKGQATIDLLGTILPAVIREIPFPKSMRWGSGSLNFARPIQWLLAVYDSRSVVFAIDGMQSVSATRGHRFMAPDAIVVEDFGQYVEDLRKAHVLVNPEDRRAAVVAAVTRASQSVGGQVLPDEELVETVTNLVESPYAICGSFDRRFLQLPDAVLITSMREHQKYFAVVDDGGRLMPHFIAVNNTDVKDVNLGAKGHQRVLRARLEDAFFFFNEDRKKKLASRGADLGGLLFQAGLGTMQEKTDRIVVLSATLARQLAPESVTTVGKVARLAKADLLTAMVNEFPTLQGVIGREYALLDGEDEEVADGIREHYLPLRAGGVLPHGIAGALVGMVDRIDTIAGCFGLGRTPTGAADPYGLRRLAIGLLHLIDTFGCSFSLSAVVRESLYLYGDKIEKNGESTVLQVMEFIKGRYVNALTANGIPLEAVEAVTSISFDDPADCRRRIDALASISSKPVFTKLAGSFKRVRNIIKNHDKTSVAAALLVEDAEKILYDVYLQVQREADPLLAARQYDQALECILQMTEPVDRFFDDVLVMADDERIKENRLTLLAAIAELFLRVGDFSKMYTL